jgi:hypothetical protein
MGGWCPQRKLYKCDRVVCGTKPEDQDWDYDKTEYELGYHTIGKIVCYLHDSEIMALEIYNINGRCLVDANGNWNMRKRDCDKRVIALEPTERIVGMNFKH